MAAFSKSFEELLPLWQSALGGGKLTAIDPTDRMQRKSDLFKSLNRCLVGDVHELDLETAEAVRKFACEQCLGNRRPETAHFCAATLLAHLMRFNGAGFGQTEAPLVLAICAIRVKGEWLSPTSRLLALVYDGYARTQMGANAAYVGVPAILLGQLIGASKGSAIEQCLDADLEQLKGETNEDRYTNRLVHQLMTEVRKAPISLSQDSIGRLLRLYNG